MEAGLVPLGLLGIDGGEELKVEGVFLAVAGALEVDGGFGEVEFLVGDVAESDLKEYFIFALSPLDDGVADLLHLI